MDIVAILALVAKGLTVAQALFDAGQSATPAITALVNLITGAQKGSVTAADLAKTEALLDAMVTEFNIDLPAAQPGDPDYVKPV